jgi:radical SAM/SPASM domain FxsB family protein
MSPYSTFILKVANRCNINCDYCYVFNAEDQAAWTMPARMGDDVVSAAAMRVRSYALRHSLEEVTLLFHGGEPLLLGPARASRFMEAITATLAPDVAVKFEVQTNATLINAEWVELFESFGVRVGVSLDGPPRANDRHRLTARGRSTSNATVRGLEFLAERPQLFAGILAVVDLRNDPGEVYEYLESFKPPLIDFNLPHATHEHPPIRGTAGIPEYGLWLYAVYKRWLESGAPSSIRIFEDIVGLTVGLVGSVETLGVAPANSIVIESNGDIESIDTLRVAQSGSSRLELSVFHDEFDSAGLELVELLRQGGMAPLSHTCQECELVKVCGGGHVPHRFKASNGYLNPSVYCVDLFYLISNIQADVRRRRQDER